MVGRYLHTRTDAEQVFFNSFCHKAHHAAPFVAQTISHFRKPRLISGHAALQEKSDPQSR